MTNNSGATLSAIAFGFFASGVSATFSNAGKVTGNKAGRLSISLADS